jgi:polysaccharide biosynthesis protein PslH
MLGQQPDPSRRMRILFLSPRQCWPASSGAKLREYHFVRALGRRAELTHLFFAQPGAAASTTDSLPCCRIIPVTQPRMYTPAKIVRGLVGAWPLPILNYTSEEMQRSVARLLQEQHFDLVHLESIHMAAYAQLVARAAPMVYNWHNIESEAMRRYGSIVASLPKKAYACWTARRLAILEKSILKQAFGHLVCSAREQTELLRITPQARIAVIENGVDTSFFAGGGSPAHASRNRLVFVGSMSYHANIAAATYFARRLWPDIRARFPRWRLTIVGSDPAPAVAALRHTPGVEVTGTVPDVRPYYRDAVAAVVPLRAGSGTRLKILEAMAAGVPVVSTTLGAEGLAVSPDKHILIADRDKDWLPALAALSNDDRRGAMIAASLQLVRARYDWEVLGDALFATYFRWLSEAT